MKKFKVCLCAFLLFIGLTVLSSSAFAQQSGDFYYTVSDGTVTITGYTCPNGAAVIPATINGMPVVGIGYYAFAYCTGLTSVTIPDSVTSIGESAFYYCSALASVTIGNSVISIGVRAFANCSSLTSLTIPNSVTSIGESAFYYCTGLTSVTIPNSVTSIGRQAFYGCAGLTSVTIPKSVASIEGSAFAYCYSLTSIIVDESNTVYSSQDGVLYNEAKTVLIEYPGGKSVEFTIPNSVISIGDSAFYYCNRLTRVTIPDSVTSIGDWAFAYCYNLTSMTIPNSVTSIGDSAFWGCSALTSVTIPNGVTSIGDWAFAFSGGLTSVIIGNSVTRIGESAFGICTHLTSIVVDASNPAYSSQDGVLYNKAKTVLIQYPGGKAGGFTIPDSVTSIGDSAFRVSSLTSVIIPDSVTSIGSYAFNDCSGLTSVTIGNSVTSIGSFAFNNCRTLTRVYFNGNAPSMGDYVFDGAIISICYTAEATGFTTPTWYGYPASVCGETLIALLSFTATPKNKEVILEWKTESEIDNAGFNLYRSESENGEYVKINGSLILAQGSSIQGASYEFVDKDVKNRRTYWYKLEDIDLNGVSTFHGPVSATPRLMFKLRK